MRICVKDLSGTGSKHDPLSVNYVVVGGLDSTSICWCNVTLGSLFNCVVTTILLRIHRPQSLSRRVLPIIRSLQNLQCPWSSLCVMTTARRIKILSARKMEQHMTMNACTNWTSAREWTIIPCIILAAVRVRLYFYENEICLPLTRWFGIINWVDDVNWPLLIVSKLTFRADGGLTLETSALRLLTVANLRYQLSW